MGDSFEFIVLGAGRGGTSLLAGLLDYSESLAVEYERFARECLMGEEVHAEDASILPARVEAFLGACREASLSYPAKKYGNKITTEQLYGLEDHNRANPHGRVDILHAFFNVYAPHIKIVFILRDGRTCVRSKVARTGQSVQLACERWLFSVKVWEFLRDHHQNNVLIRYEDLLTRPESVLAAVTGFLGVPFDMAMMKGTMNPKMRPEYRQEGFDLSRLELDNIPEGCVQLIHDGLVRTGYL